MAEHPDVSLGEIYRLVQDLKTGFRDHQKEMREDRLELRQQLSAAREEVREALAPIAVLETTVGDHARQLTELAPKVNNALKDTAVNAAIISIGITIMGVLATFLLQGRVGH